jgi:hypothetical protein
MPKDCIESCICGYKYIKKEEDWQNRSIENGTEPFLYIRVEHATLRIDGGGYDDLIACPKCRTVKVGDAFYACAML